MKTIARLSVVSLAAVSGLFFAPTEAHAADSTHGPWYVQGSPIGFASFTTCFDGIRLDANAVPHTQSICGSYGAYRVSVEGGYHFSGRHDGFVLGLRQTLLIAGGVGGLTQVRAGWDIPIPIKDFELTIAPYGVVGVAYAFSGGSPSLALGAGIDVKFFFMNPESSAKGLFAYAQPIEIGGAFAGAFSGLVIQAGVGMGYAF